MDRQNLVIVIDGNFRMREALADLLESAGYGARTFSTAEQALASKAVETGYCVISDSHMMDMDRYELQKRINALNSNLPIILISSEPPPAEFCVAGQFRMPFRLYKPVDGRQLLQTLTRLRTSASEKSELQ